jgi:hypothetical protein
VQFPSCLLMRLAAIPDLHRLTGATSHQRLPTFPTVVTPAFRFSVLPALPSLLYTSSQLSFMDTLCTKERWRRLRWLQNDFPTNLFHRVDKLIKSSTSSSFSVLHSSHIKNEIFTELSRTRKAQYDVAFHIGRPGVDAEWWRLQPRGIRLKFWALELHIKTLTRRKVD